MWLWWIVPAVSLATCLVVFTYSIASEGVHGQCRTSLVTILDENNHRASTLGFVSYYCPLTPSDGLHFSYDTAVAGYTNGPYVDPYRQRRSRSRLIGPTISTWSRAGSWHRFERAWPCA